MAKSAFLAKMHAGFGVPAEVVVGLAERATGRDVAGMERVVRGYDNEVYRADLTGGDAIYVRIARAGSDDFANEAWAMGQAASVGVPVPAVLAVGVVVDDDGERPAMVAAAAPGRQLDGLLDALALEDRRLVMTNVGRVLATLHTVSTPGVWRADGNGDWADPAELWDGWIAERRAERPHLVAAGLSEDEVERTLAFLGTSPDTPAQTDPVLCHGDISPEHVFVDEDLNVSGLIDWGMWHGGSVIGELAQVAMVHSTQDLDAILAGYGVDADEAVRRAINLSLVNQIIGHLAHHVSIDDAEGAAQTVAVLRRVLAELSQIPTGAGTTGGRRPHAASYEGGPHTKGS